MAVDLGESSPHIERFFDALLTRDGAGGSWLAGLLGVAPRGRERLGELVDAPGWLEVLVAVHTETGRRGGFEYPSAPTRSLLRWYLDHPDELIWDDAEDASRETIRLRRVLIDDEPPGMRARAQERARDLMRSGASPGGAWWRFEGTRRAGCTLLTDRLALVVVDGDGDRVSRPATPWFPQRPALLRDLESTERLADGAKAWGVLVLCRDPAAEPVDVAAAVQAGTPHLDVAQRAELVDGYLGRCSWERAAAATGLAVDAVPGVID